MKKMKKKDDADEVDDDDVDEEEDNECEKDGDEENEEEDDGDMDEKDNETGEEETTAIAEPPPKPLLQLRRTIVRKITTECLGRKLCLKYN